MGTTKGFFSALSNLYHFYQLYSARKYVGMSPLLLHPYLFSGFTLFYRTIL
jgi:hypothetical protein